MAQDVRDIRGRDPRVERDEHRARERHGVVRGEQHVRIAREHRHAVARGDVHRLQGTGHTQAALVKRSVGEARVAVDDADAVAEDVGRAAQERGRRQRCVVELRWHAGSPAACKGPGPPLSHCAPVGVRRRTPDDRLQSSIATSSNWITSAWRCVLVLANTDLSCERTVASVMQLRSVMHRPRSGR